MSIPSDQIRTLSYDVAHVLHAAGKLEKQKAAALLAATRLGITPDDAVEVVNAFAASMRAADWDCYRWLTERLPADAVPRAIGAALDEYRQHQEDRNAEGTNKYEESQPSGAEGSDDAASITAEQSKLAELEKRFGGDIEFVYRDCIATSPPGYLPCFRNLPGDLKRELVEPFQFRTYEHDIHDFLFGLLTALGKENRSQRQIVSLCGEQLFVLFADENDHPEGSFGFRQMVYLLEDHLDDKPDDWIGIAWLAQLMSRRDGNKAACVLAERLWQLTADLPATAVVQLVRFSLGMDGWGYDPDFDNGDPYSELCRVSGRWLQEDEYFATALLRRALSAGHLDGNILNLTAELVEAGYCEHDILPWNHWVRLAYWNRFNPYSYRQCWKRALAVAIDDEDHERVFLSIPFQFVGVVGIRAAAPSEVREWLALLKEEARTKEHREAAAKLLVGLRVIDESVKFLSQDICLEIRAEASGKFAKEIEAVEADERDMGALTVVARYLTEQPGAEPVLVGLLSEELWAKLDDMSKDDLRVLQTFFDIGQQSPGNSVIHDTMIMKLCCVIEREFFGRAAAVIKKNVFGDKRTVGAIIYFLKIPDPSYKTNKEQLRAQGIQLAKLMEMIDDLGQLNHLRTRAVHGAVNVDAGKVGRKAARRAYAKWLPGGLLKEMLLALHCC